MSMLRNNIDLTFYLNIRRLYVIVTSVCVTMHQPSNWSGVLDNSIDNISQTADKNMK